MNLAMTSAAGFGASAARRGAAVAIRLGRRAIPRRPVRRSRSSRWVWLAVAASLALVGCGDAPSTDAARVPNGHDVMLFVVDTLRADHLGCYGYDRPTSPHIDALAARGARAEVAIAQSSWTAPSMVSLFTSRFVAADFVRMPSPPTLAERLREAGYRTLGFQFNTLLDRGYGFERGFDAYLVEPGLKDVRAALMESGRGGPRFLYFHFVEPHDPYAPLDGFDVFEPRPLPEWRRVAMRDYLDEVAPHLEPAEVERRVRAAEEHITREVARYDGEVRQVDAAFHTMCQVLEAQGRLDRTLIVFAADHGEALWQHREATSLLGGGGLASDLLRAFKQTHNSLLEDALVRVPLLLAGPGVPPGTTIPGMSANVDIVPTILEALGLPEARGIDGRSLLPGAGAASAAWPGRDLVFSQTSVFTAARTRSGHKLIVPTDPDSGDVERYYRLTADPEERAPGPAPRDLDRLREAIAAFRQDVGLRPESGEDVVDSEFEERMRQLGYLGGR